MLFTPVAMVTGWFTWWLNYESRPLKPVVIKLILSPVLLLVGSCRLGLALFNPEILVQFPGGAQPGLCGLAVRLNPLVGVIGAYGAD